MKELNPEEFVEVKAVPEREYPSYSLMISRLFKQMPEVPFASAMHAAIGLSGEAAEWLAANNRKNVFEEGGDMEFYIEALKQHVAADIEGAVALQVQDLRAVNCTIGSVFTNVVTITGDILDVVKKSWVYSSSDKPKPLNHAEITRLVMVLELNLELIYEMFGTDRKEIQHLNQVKLIGPGGRFESGFYSDSAAIARKDKQPGEDRSFFGKEKIAPSYNDPPIDYTKPTPEGRFTV